MAEEDDNAYLIGNMMVQVDEQQMNSDPLDFSALPPCQLDVTIDQIDPSVFINTDVEERSGNGEQEISSTYQPNLEKCAHTPEGYSVPDTPLHQSYVGCQPYTPLYHSALPFQYANFSPFAPLSFPRHPSPMEFSQAPYHQMFYGRMLHSELGFPHNIAMPNTGNYEVGQFPHLSLPSFESSLSRFLNPEYDADKRVEVNSDISLSTSEASSDNCYGNSLVKNAFVNNLSVSLEEYECNTNDSYVEPAINDNIELPDELKLEKSKDENLTDYELFENNCGILCDDDEIGTSDLSLMQSKEEIGQLEYSTSVNNAGLQNGDLKENDVKFYHKRKRTDRFRKCKSLFKKSDCKSFIFKPDRPKLKNLFSFSWSSNITEELNGQTSTIFQCKLCEYSSSNKSNFRNHLFIHSDERQFACPYCPYKGKQSAGLRAHLKVHSVEKPHKCIFCPYRCKRKQNLIQHLRIHSKYRPFQCKTCSYRTTTKQALQKHICRQPSVKNELTSNDQQISSLEKFESIPQHDVSRECTEDEKSCNKSNQDTEHHLIVENSVPSLGCSDECPPNKPIENCSKSFLLDNEVSSTQENISSKMELLDKRKSSLFFCPNCDFTSTRKCAMGNHVKTHEKNYFCCPICIFKCRTAGTLRLHLNTHSRAKKPKSLLKCTYCVFRTFNTDIFVSHMKEHKNNIKNNSGLNPRSCDIFYQCPYCAYDCLIFSAFKLHITNHSEDDLRKFCRPPKIENNDLSAAVSNFSYASGSSINVNLNSSNEMELANFSGIGVSSMQALDKTKFENENFPSDRVPNKGKTSRISRCAKRTLHKTIKYKNDILKSDSNFSLLRTSPQMVGKISYGSFHPQKSNVNDSNTENFSSLKRKCEFGRISPSKLKSHLPNGILNLSNLDQDDVSQNKVKILKSKSKSRPNVKSTPESMKQIICALQTIHLQDLENDFVCDYERSVESKKVMRYANGQDFVCEQNLSHLSSGQNDKNRRLLTDPQLLMQNDNFEAARNSLSKMPIVCQSDDFKKEFNFLKLDQPLFKTSDNQKNYNVTELNKHSMEDIKIESYQGNYLPYNLTNDVNCDIECNKFNSEQPRTEEAEKEVCVSELSNAGCDVNFAGQKSFDLRSAEPTFKVSSKFGNLEKINKNDRLNVTDIKLDTENRNEVFQAIVPHPFDNHNGCLNETLTTKTTIIDKDDKRPTLQNCMLSSGNFQDTVNICDSLGKDYKMNSMYDEVCEHNKTEKLEQETEIVGNVNVTKSSDKLVSDGYKLTEPLQVDNSNYYKLGNSEHTVEEEICSKSAECHETVNEETINRKTSFTDYAKITENHVEQDVVESESSCTGDKGINLLKKCIEIKELKNTDNVECRTNYNNKLDENVLKVNNEVQSKSFRFEKDLQPMVSNATFSPSSTPLLERCLTTGFNPYCEPVVSDMRSCTSFKVVKTGANDNSSCNSGELEDKSIQEFEEYCENLPLSSSYIPATTSQSSEQTLCHTNIFSVSDSNSIIDAQPFISQIESSQVEMSKFIYSAPLEGHEIDPYMLKPYSNFENELMHCYPINAPKHLSNSSLEDEPFTAKYPLQSDDYTPQLNAYHSLECEQFEDYASTSLNNGYQHDLPGNENSRSCQQTDENLDFSIMNILKSNTNYEDPFSQDNCIISENPDNCSPLVKSDNETFQQSNYPEVCPSHVELGCQSKVIETETSIYPSIKISQGDSHSDSHTWTENSGTTPKISVIKFLKVGENNMLHKISSNKCNSLILNNLKNAKTFKVNITSCLATNAVNSAESSEVSQISLNTSSNSGNSKINDSLSNLQFKFKKQPQLIIPKLDVCNIIECQAKSGENLDYFQSFQPTEKSLSKVYDSVDKFDNDCSDESYAVDDLAFSGDVGEEQLNIKPIDDFNIDSESVCDNESNETLDSQSDLGIDSLPVLCEDKSKYCCHICDKTYTRKSSFANHWKSHKRILLKCSLCSFTCKQKQAFFEHQRKQHEGKLHYNCTKCDFSSTRKCNLMSHIKIHKNMFNCNSCSFSCKSEIQLVAHSLEHKKEYECSLCSFVCLSTKELCEHSSLAHKKRHKCPECCFKAHTLKEVNEHRSSVHAKVLIKCHSCNYETNSSLFLKFHMKKHQRDSIFLTCKECKYVASSKLDLYKHSSSHNSKQDYKCVFCDNVFLNSSEFRDHLFKVHSIKTMSNQK